MKSKIDRLRDLILDKMESKTDETKYINPVLKNNPAYRAGVNNGLLLTLTLITTVYKNDKR